MAKDDHASVYSIQLACKTILATFIGNHKFGKPHAVHLNAAHEELREWDERVSLELEIRAVVENVGT